MARFIVNKKFYHNGVVYDPVRINVFDDKGVDKKVLESMKSSNYIGDEIKTAKKEAPAPSGEEK